jgi:hypothetical protein
LLGHVGEREPLVGKRAVTIRPDEYVAHDPAPVEISLGILVRLPQYRVMRSMMRPDLLPARSSGSTGNTQALDRWVAISNAATGASKCQSNLEPTVRGC